jgi:hypothetical protein
MILGVAAAAATRKTGIDHRHDEIGHVPDLDRPNPHVDHHHLLLMLMLMLLLMPLLLQTQPTRSFKKIVEPAWPGCVKK